MEIQYAMFCENITFPDKPSGRIMITQPITSPVITKDKVDAAQLEAPLFVTFLNGRNGVIYNLKVKITDSYANTQILRDFKFTWGSESLAYANCFVVKIPKFHVPNTLHFTLYLDGEESHTINMPIIQKP